MQKDGWSNRVSSLKTSTPSCHPKSENGSQPSPELSKKHKRRSLTSLEIRVYWLGPPTSMTIRAASWRSTVDLPRGKRSLRSPTTVLGMKLRSLKPHPTLPGLQSSPERGSAMSTTALATGSRRQLVLPRLQTNRPKFGASSGGHSSTTDYFWQ